MSVRRIEEYLYKNSVPRRRRRPPSEWKRIREVLLRRRASYDVRDVPQLLGITPAVLQAAIDEGVITALRTGGEEIRIAWEDVVTLGLEHRWTPRMLAEAMRGVRGDALPPRVRVVKRPVALPRYQWEVLRLLAARQSQEQGREITVSDLIEDAVSTAVLMRIEEWEHLEAALPGVRAAAEWPDPA